MTAAFGRWIAALAVVIGAMAIPGAARGAEYIVRACGATAGYQNHLLTPYVSDGRMTTDSLCPTDGAGHNVGAAAMAGINQGTVPVFSNARQSFLAPEGTTIRHVHVKGEAQTWNGDWVSLLQASNDRFGSSLWNVSGCNSNPGSVNGCVAALSNLDQDYDFSGATGFRSLVACGHFAGCTTFGTGVWPSTRAYYFIRE